MKLSASTVIFCLASTSLLLLSGCADWLSNSSGLFPGKNPASATVRHQPKMDLAILRAINAARVNDGLCRLERHPGLDRIAWAHTLDMIKVRRISHYGPDRLTAGGRANRAGIAWQEIGENVARNHGYKDPAVKAVLDWLASQGHSENIYNPKFTHTGIGIARGRNGYVYLTQVFMLPMPE